MLSDSFPFILTDYNLLDLACGYSSFDNIWSYWDKKVNTMRSPYHRKLSFSQRSWWIHALLRDLPGWTFLGTLSLSSVITLHRNLHVLFLKLTAGSAAGAKQGLAHFRWCKCFAVKVGLNIKSHFSDYLLNRRRRWHVLLINFQVHNAKTASSAAVTIADKAKV